MSTSKTTTPKRQRRLKAFAQSLGQFLTPAGLRQAYQARRQGRTPRSSRWRVEPLVLVLVLFTWCQGDSVAERFEAARGCYVLCHARRRRPGRSVDGFQTALARLPVAVLRTLAGTVRRRLMALFAASFRVSGWAVFGVDGSRLECPRTAELERRIGTAGKKHIAPMLWVTAVVHLRSGLLWAWRLGKARASERDHALRLLPTLPKGALLVADAGFNGYGLARAILDQQLSFLIRMSAKVTLLVKQLATPGAREGIVYYWPEANQQAGQPALQVRLICVRGKKKGQDVWLLTNVLERAKLPKKLASQFYRWRWENEGLFRTYKRTLKKVKLLSRTVRLVHREAEGTLLATQLLLAQGTLALNPPHRQAGTRPLAKCSPRQVLLTLRAVIEENRPPRRGPSFERQLQQARREQRPRRSVKEKRRWPRPNTNHKPPKPPKMRELTESENRTLAWQKPLETD